MTNLIKHIRDHLKENVQNMIFKCEKCDKQFEKYKNLRKHNRTTHLKIKYPKNTEGKYTCDQCPKELSNKFALKAHINAVHNKYRPHVCHICGHGNLFYFLINFTKQMLIFPTQQNLI